MQREREILVKKVFPQVRRWCEARGLVWHEVDLRWGVTAEASALGLSVQACLEEVELCRPFYICLLGERYGFVPQSLPDETFRRFPWISKHAGVSVTELEILHGALLQQNRPDTTFFYFRNPRYLDHLSAMESRQDFESENQQAKEKLEDLKRRIRQTYGVKEYSAPEKLEAVLLRDMMKMLEELFPQSQPPTWLEEEANAQSSFAGVHREVFFGYEADVDRLEALAHFGGRPLAVVGKAGVGKSTLLATWLGRRQGCVDGRWFFIPPSWSEQLNQFRFWLRFAGRDDEPILVSHFAGATGAQESWLKVVRRLVSLLLEIDGREMTVAEDPLTLVSLFTHLLHKICTFRKFVLVLDGLDQLRAPGADNGLAWLPSKLPQNLRLIASFRTDDFVEDWRHRGWQILNLRPLATPAKARFVRDYLGLFGKVVDEPAMTKIIASPSTSEPLYLRTLLEELRVFGQFEHFQARLAKCLEAQTTQELFATVIARLEQDFAGASGGLARDALAFVAVSRQGLAEIELADLLGSPEMPLPALHWSPLFLAARSAFTNGMGMIRFHHPDFATAVQARYFQETGKEKAYRSRLLDYFGQRKDSLRAVAELPWQMEMLCHWQQLAQLLGEADFLRRLWEHSPGDVRLYWSRIQQNSAIRLVSIYRNVINQPELHPGIAEIVLRLVLQLESGAAGKAFVKWLESDDSGQRDPHRRLELLHLRALVCRASGDHRGCLALFQARAKLAQSLDDRAAYAASLGHQAVILRELGYTTAALRLFQQEESICREVSDHFGLITALGNQGTLLFEREPAQALKLFRDQENACRLVGDTAGLQTSLGNQGTLLMALGKSGRGLRYLQQQENICRQLSDWTGLQVCLGNQALAQQKLLDYDAAWKCLTERETVCLEQDLREGRARALYQQAFFLKHRMGARLQAREKIEEGLRLARSNGLDVIARDFEKLRDEMQ